jgi:type IV pilus assembly protein PilC
MLFSYQARTHEGLARSGSIEAPSVDGAVQALQRQNLVVLSVRSTTPPTPLMMRIFGRFGKPKQRDIMLLSRQLSTLFEAKVPVVQTFRTLISQSASGPMRANLTEVLDDVQGGMSMSQAMAKHPAVFSNFFVNMVRSGEESGKLDDVFSYLADYLERTYALVTKTRNALIYPAFILTAFFGVVILLLTVVIPKLTAIIIEAGQELPIYTRIVIGTSDFLRNYGVFLLLLVLGSGFFLYRYIQTPEGRRAWSRTQLAVPIVGPLFQKFYLARLSDNLQTLITGGVPIVRALQITADVVGNEIYKGIILESIEAVRAGSTIADAFDRHTEIPPLLTQMMRIGEETGKLDQILKSIARFYSREVESLVDNLVALIEPILILILGLGIGLIVASVLLPIYNLTQAF